MLSIQSRFKKSLADYYFSYQENETDNFRNDKELSIKGIEILMKMLPLNHCVYLGLLACINDCFDL